jgi:sugar phosphate isomerase/epimerase
MIAQTATALGLQVLGFLGGVEQIENEADVLFSSLREVGASDVGISGYQTTEAGALAFAERVNAAAKRVRDAGFTFSYHNHHHEFVRTACGKTVMELYLEKWDACVDLMPDTYWLQRAGIDVRDFIEKNASRIKILHLKDLECAEVAPLFASLGEGNLNLNGIVSEALRLGIRALVVEQDECREHPLVCIEKSYLHLKTLIEK